MRTFLPLLGVLLFQCSSSSSNPSDAATGDDGGDESAAVDAAGDGEGGAPMCDPGSKPGADFGNVKTPHGTNIYVRVPMGYDPTVGAPLIVVYAPCCVDGLTTQSFTGLTVPSTTRGYMVAYVDHITPQSTADYQEAASAPAAVAAQYCVDPNNLFLTGHSDGGSLVEILTFENLLAPNAIAPSASGVNASQLTASLCPKHQTPVFEQHSSGDQLFPVNQGFGANVAKWWAGCDGCTTEGQARSDGCIPYQGCSSPLQVLYCQGTAVHGVWPMRDSAILDFFDMYRQ